MKKVMAALIVFSLVSAGVISFAATTASVGVEATVPQELELTSWIRSAPAGGDPYGTGSADATSFNFGTLTKDTTYGIWTSDRYFSVFLLASTSGRDYRMQQTCTNFLSGSQSLNDSLIMTPDYQTADEIVDGTAQGSMPGGDSLGSASLAVGVNKVIYNGNAGLSRIVRAYYGLATGAASEPAGAEPITADQVSGTYTGTITFSVVLQ